MIKENAIKYFRKGEIDTDRWDLCIQNSLNCLPYAFSWYLDRMAGNWDALVLGDYLYVMPLPTGEKMGIHYLMQPVFLQQLGIFSPFEISTELVNQFLDQIPKKFWYINLNLNFLNIPGTSSFSVRGNKNYQLDLSRDYRTLYENYSENAKRNLKKAGKNHLQVYEVHDTAEFLTFVRTSLDRKSLPLEDFHYKRLQSLIDFSKIHESGKVLGVYSRSNTLCAAVFFLTTAGNHFYLVAASNEEGIESKAMFLLVDHYIRKNAGRHELLDFEGSNIPGVARFYAGFGATPFTYFSIKKNRLPWPLKLFKK